MADDRYMDRSSPIGSWIPAVVLLLAMLTSACQKLSYVFHGAEGLGFQVVSRDTTWKRSSSPHLVDRSILILPGTTLKIEPGAEVVLGSQVTIFCQGRILAIGEPDRPIRIHGRQGTGWGKIDCFGTENAPTPQEGSVFRHCIVEDGQGIVARASSLIVEASIFRNNASTPLRMEFSSGRIVGNDIHHNSTELDAAGGNGGGIVVYTDKEVRIEGNLVHDNWSSGGRDGGGGIYAYAYDAGKVTVARNRIYRNRSDRHGGGLVAYSCDVEENRIVENRAEHSGGGIYAIQARLRNNRIERNDAQGGGGIYAENTLIEQNTVVDNTAPPGTGGGLYSFGDSRVVRNTFVGNGSPGQAAGEAIVVSGNTVLNLNNIVVSRGLALRVQTHSLAQDLDATGNFWGTRDEKMILARIHDWFDDGQFGIVNWKGFQTDWAAGAPMPPPSLLLCRTSREKLSISWEYPPQIPVCGFRLTWSSTEDFSSPGTVDLPPGLHRAEVPRPLPGEFFARLCALERASDHELVEGPSSSTLSIPAQADLGQEIEEKTFAVNPVQPGTCEPPLEAILRLEAAREPSGGPWARARWVVSEDPGDFSSTVFDSGPVSGEAAVPVPEGSLQPAREYAWRAAFQDPQGNWTDWSPAMRFCTPPEPADLLAGPLEGSRTLGGQGAEALSFRGNVLIPETASLEILPGTVVQISSDRIIRVRGRLVAQGEKDRPVRFTGDPSSPWGQLFFEGRGTEVGTSEAQEGTDSGILRNCVVEHGRGILVEESGLRISDCTIRKNQGSGISVRDGTVRIVGNQILENESPTNGGGIYAYGSKPVLIQDNRILNNSAQEDGGGVFSYGYRSTTAIHLEGNRIEGNRCGGDGAGVWASRSSVLKNRILSNQAAGSGGGLFATFALVEGNEIRTNTAFQGGGVYAETNSSLVGNRIVENRVLGNVGGGVYLNFWGVSIENEEFRKNLVARNRAEGAQKNGGIYLNGSMVFEYNQIFGNDGSQLHNANPADHPPLSAPHCYWGSRKTKEIEAGIHHATQDPKLAIVEFEPFAQSPEAAPVP